MAKFGLFGDGATPLQTFEGDRMVQDKDYVVIYQKDAGGKTQQVAAIKLADGQSVKKIS